MEIRNYCYNWLSTSKHSLCLISAHAVIVVVNFKYITSLEEMGGYFQVHSSLINMAHGYRHRLIYIRCIYRNTIKF